MMALLRAVVTAFSCFSAIPMPSLPWDERNMRHMLAAFPLVGAVIGVADLLWWQVAQHLGLGPVLTAAGLTLLPPLVSGGIHMDGLADVIDARSSHAEPERKREILKDPHSGAFAAMGVSGYLVAYLALATELDARGVALLACTPIVSRCLSGLATVCLRPASSKGMLAAERSTADTRTVRVVLVLLLVASSALLLALSLSVGALALCAAALSLAWVRRIAYREFRGMGGDLAGFCLEVAELAMLAAIVLAERLV